VEGVPRQRPRRGAAEKKHSTDVEYPPPPEGNLPYPPPPEGNLSSDRSSSARSQRPSRAAISSDGELLISVCQEKRITMYRFTDRSEVGAVHVETCIDKHGIRRPSLWVSDSMPMCDTL